MKSVILRVCLILFFANLGLGSLVHAAAPAVPVASLASDWVKFDESKIRVFSPQTALGGQQEITLGVHFDLAPGWKTYWRMPGDAGLAPEIDFEGSENIAAASFLWPAPHRFTQAGLDSFGYKDEIILPLVVQITDAARDASLQLAVDYLVCEEICIPQQADLSLAIPAGPASATPDQELLARYVEKIPATFAKQNWQIDEAAFHRDLFHFTVTTPEPLQNPDLFIESGDHYYFHRPVVEQEGGQTHFRSRYEGLTPAEDNIDLTLTLVADTASGEVTIAAPLPDAMPKVTTHQDNAAKVSGNLGIMLLIAFLGGLVLNIMPCVLPVLSLKLLKLVDHIGEERKTIRQNFLLSAAGILLFFVLLILVVLVMRALGAHVGWGIQFQQPGFLIFMVMLLAVFAANLWGMFEIHLPAGILQWANRHSDEAGKLGYLGTGFFAALLATPCSAPFLGTALGFALSQGILPIITIFLMIGLGLATPYLLIAALPGAVRLLPRPGAWMIILKKILALALLATAIWLFWVLSMQVGDMVTLHIASFLALMMAVIGILSYLAPARQKIFSWLLLLMALGTVFYPYLVAKEVHVAATQSEDLSWEPLDLIRLARYVEEGRVVFVDVTADWCLTCKFNKKAVLERDAFQEFVAKNQVLTMRGDWTKPNVMIAEYLASFGRYGIPFNVIYSPQFPDGKPLPELLTLEDTLHALEEAF